MAHFAILCPPLPGHINPMAVLARELEARGHRTTFLGFPDMRAKLPAGQAFVRFGGEDWPEGSLAPYLERLSRLGSPLSLLRLIRDLAGFAETICTTLPAALGQIKPDGLVIDQTDAAASLVATALGIPFVNIANALPLNLEPGVPPPVLPWPYDPSDGGIRRNLGGYRVARWIERPITKVIRRHAKRLGRPDIRFADEAWSELGQVTQCIRGLDFPRRELPANFHYLGPFRGSEPPLEIDLPDDGRPLIFCSFGTLQGSRASLFRAVAESVEPLDAHLLIAHGGMLSERDIARLPGKPLVHAFFPQRAVLSRSALAITHCGFNTVLDSLAHAVPMVALPIAFEQPATAARLEHAGVGQALHRRRTAKPIREAVERVMGDARYRQQALVLSKEIAASGGAPRAAELIEQALGAGAPRATATMARAAPNDARGDSRNGSS
ncbi:glycosyltransferase [Sphingomonas mesophila]|uniref:glycosyltransferase n=1 Tax=Sphingomonas mesophila TaxID=2303576 RepID=UPI000E56B489|nr:nucleotide disphospho-sugar-binding domain-containing protein [Sphingomonas mesophila]